MPRPSLRGPSRQIRVSETVYKWLDEHGSLTETFSDVVLKLIEAYEKERKSKYHG